MSSGLGRIQLSCLRVIERHGRDGHMPDTVAIVCEVWDIKPDKKGRRTCTVAQYSSVKRALANLARKGLVAGWRDQHIRRAFWSTTAKTKEALGE
jgi:hypothetical protein